MTITVPTRVKAFAALSIVAIVGMALSPPGFAQDDQTAEGPRSRVVASHKLPRLDGGRLQVTLVEVTYAPGGSSQPHSHPCPVVGYVLEGAVRMRLGTGPEVVYKAGSQFYEEPNAQHLVSVNVSHDAPARFLAVLTCDHDEPLSKTSHADGR